MRPLNGSLAKFVGRYGKAEALRLLRDHVEVAHGQGDGPSAKAWGDIADLPKGSKDKIPRLAAPLGVSLAIAIRGVTPQGCEGP